MTEQIFDTLKCVKRLKVVGVSEKQAEEFAEVLAETIDNKLATKRDIEQIKVELKRDIKDLDFKIETNKNELRKDIKELELRMTVKLGSIMIGGLGMLIILMKLFKL